MVSFAMELPTSGPEPKFQFGANQRFKCRVTLGSPNRVGGGDVVNTV